MSLSFGISDLPSDHSVPGGIVDRFRSLRKIYPHEAFSSTQWGVIAKIEKKQAQSCVAQLVHLGEMETIRGGRPYRYKFKNFWERTSATADVRALELRK